MRRIRNALIVLLAGFALFSYRGIQERRERALQTLTQVAGTASGTFLEVKGTLQGALNAGMATAEWFTETVQEVGSGIVKVRRGYEEIRSGVESVREGVAGE